MSCRDLFSLFGYQGRLPNRACQHASDHGASFPEKLPLACILAGSKPNDIVLDPFAGSGTTGRVADRIGRSAWMIELNDEYAISARTKRTMEQYREIVKRTLSSSDRRRDRTGVGTRAIFGTQMRFNLADGFPLLTLKKTHWHSIKHELFWMLKGATSLDYLHENKVTIWDEWADDEGELGPVYGAQWRGWKDHEGKQHDQLMAVMDSLRKDPAGRRHIISAWNVGQLHEMALAPCHCFMQFFVGQNQATGRKHLSCQMYQRSTDVFLGLPFNIASYALLIHLMAHCLQLDPGELVHVGGDVHLYENHAEQAELMLSRSSRPLPTLRLNHNFQAVFPTELRAEHVELVGYEPHPHIKADVAV